MIRQYFAHRRRGGCNPLGVGVIPVGAIFYIQDEGWWRDRYRGAPIWEQSGRFGPQTSRSRIFASDFMARKFEDPKEGAFVPHSAKYGD